jgi:hypothetical protein
MKIKTFFLSLLFALSLTGQAQIQAVGLVASGLQVAKANEPELQTWLDRGTALGYSLPSAAQIVYLNNFCKCLKENDIYSYLDIMYIFAIDGDSDMATINFITPASYQITKVNTPTFTTNQGFDFNGTTQNLNTGFSPLNNGIHFTQNDASAFVFINDNVSVNGTVAFGASDNSDGSTNGILINGRNASGQSNTRINDNVSLNYSSSSSIGLWQTKRLGTSGTRKYFYLNGSEVANSATVSTTTPTSSIYIGASNGNGAATLYNSREVSFFAAGNSMDGKELKFYNCWNTYKTAIGL